MAEIPQPPAQSKAIVFARRSASTLFLWALVTSIFMSRYTWAFLALISVLTIVATVEYFQMLRAAEVKCFSRFGILLSVIYSGTLYFCFMRGDHEVSFAVDALALFIAIAGGLGPLAGA